MTTKKIDTLIFDLNGTLYERGIPVNGAIQTINTLREKGYHLNFVTNTDGRCINDVYSNILSLGLKISKEELLTPVSAVKRFIEMNPDKSYHLLVHDDLLSDLDFATLNHVNPDYVIIGDFCDKVSFDLMNKTFRMIKNGAEIIALSKTLWYKDDDGDSLNTGAFVGLFESACDKQALLMGKPSLDFLKMALSRTNSLPENTLVLGDDISTDIYGGSILGATTALVKTGIFDEAKLIDSHIKPNYIIDSVKEVSNILNL